MASNRLLLVCKYCQNIEDAYCIGERVGNDVQFIAPSLKRMDDWYGKHFKCGPGCDHIAFAMHRPADWDHSPPAESTPAGAVRMALVNGASIDHPAGADWREPKH